MDKSAGECAFPASLIPVVRQTPVAGAGNARFRSVFAQLFPDVAVKKRFLVHRSAQSAGTQTKEKNGTNKNRRHTTVFLPSQQTWEGDKRLDLRTEN